MNKAPEAFRTISEAAAMLGVPAHVLRFWESRFTQIKPVKRAGGRRYYRQADLRLLDGIRRLLHEDGLTIRGVQKLLREEGVRHVTALGAPELEAGPANEEAGGDRDSLPAGLGEAEPLGVAGPEEFAPAAFSPEDNQPEESEPEAMQPPDAPEALPRQAAIPGGSALASADLPTDESEPAAARPLGAPESPPQEGAISAGSALAPADLPSDESEPAAARPRGAPESPPREATVPVASAPPLPSGSEAQGALFADEAPMAEDVPPGPAPAGRVLPFTPRFAHRTAAPAAARPGAPPDPRRSPAAPAEPAASAPPAPGAGADEAGPHAQPEPVTPDRPQQPATPSLASEPAASAPGPARQADAPGRFPAPAQPADAPGVPPVPARLTEAPDPSPATVRPPMTGQDAAGHEAARAARLHALRQRLAALPPDPADDDSRFASPTLDLARLPRRHTRLKPLIARLRSLRHHMDQPSPPREG